MSKEHNINKISIWVAWLLVSMFFAYQYILRVLPNIIMPDLMKKFDVNSGVFGQFAGIYYVTYAAMHIPIGALLDRKGPKVVIPVCIFLAVLGTLPLIYLDSWILACVGRALLGAGSAGAILGLFKVIHLGFPEDKFSRMLGIGATIGLSGAIYGGQPVRGLIIDYGFSSVILCVSAIGVMLGLLSFFFMPKVKGIKNDNINLSRDLSQLWKKKPVFIISILGGLMIGPLEGFADAWGTTFLEVVYNLDPNTAALLPSKVFLGMAIGTTVIAYLAEKTQWYRGITISCALVSGALFSMILFTKVDRDLLVYILFIIGIAAAYQVLVVYRSTTYVSENIVGLCTSIVNMVMMIFGYFFHTIIGKIITYGWDGTKVDGICRYSPESYINAMAIIPVALFIAAIGFIFMGRSDRSNK